MPMFVCFSFLLSLSEFMYAISLMLVWSINTKNLLSVYVDVVLDDE